MTGTSLLVFILAAVVFLTVALVSSRKRARRNAGGYSTDDGFFYAPIGTSDGGASPDCSSADAGCSDGGGSDGGGGGD